MNYFKTVTRLADVLMWALILLLAIRGALSAWDGRYLWALAYLTGASVAIAFRFVRVPASRT